MKTVFYTAAALAAVFGATAAQADDTIYNSAPADGWHYGSGNDYSPANTKVLKIDGGDELALRFHQTFQKAPESVGSLYSFGLGTDPLSFDWGIDAGDFGGVTALLTLTNLGNGMSWSYDPLLANDEPVVDGSAQNSFRFNWVNDGVLIDDANPGFGYLITPVPGFFNSSIDGLYRVKLDVFGLASGDKSIYADAKFGAGAPAVPEPATWAMMLLGMGLVGATMRRKAKVGVRVRYT